jgi:hypothetical protein
MSQNLKALLKNEATKENSLYQVLDLIPKKEVDKRNKKKEWVYGYNQEFDVVVISKDGTIGEVYNIQGLKVALPSAPNKGIKIRDKKPEEQYWEADEYPKELSKIKSIFQWNDMPKDFKGKWVDYIEEEFNKRDEGMFFMNNGTPSYITGSHYMYLQWTKIDIGLPEFRESNRIYWIFWEACKADDRSFGICYLKNRRSGFSFMGSSELVNTATISKDSRLGILSKTGGDAKKMFTDKVVPISSNYPFFFKPIMDGMDKPKTEISYRVPASKITKNNMSDAQDEMEGLDTSIDWANTGDNSYDGEKLKLLVHDESGKWLKPNNILNNWKVTQTCLRVGRKLIGKCMMGSTCNSQANGGDNFKKLYYNSDVTKRDKNGRTMSGLYALFIPMEWNFEGYIDIYGFPVFRKLDKPVQDIQGGFIYDGVLDYFENSVEALKKDSDALNEFYRQNPRTEGHAFRDEAKNSLFDLSKIYEQIDYNDGLEHARVITSGKFSWRNGVKDTQVIWTPCNDGDFKVTWIPKPEMRNKIEIKNGKNFPGNAHIGSFGCDTYDISGVVGGGGSKGSFHGLTKFNMDDAPSNHFFLEYIARPRTSEEFYENCLMACVFYGMPILIENNKVGQLKYFTNRGYRGFSLNRPDKHKNDLSSSEKELGGIPSSTQTIELQANAIEAYINQYVGIDYSGEFREEGSVGAMYFNRTLLDWANFDIANRTKFDATISSGLAIMANQTYVTKPIRNNTEIMFNFARYSNKGMHSELLK